MSHVLDKFGEYIVPTGLFNKIRKSHNLGQQFVPSHTPKLDEEHKMRLDVGDVKDSTKTAYQQVNKEAKTESLKKFRKKRTSPAKLATMTFKTDWVPEDEEAAFKEAWKSAKE
jgi:hypothetical protein